MRPLPDILVPLSAAIDGDLPLSVDDSWLGPVCDLFARIQRTAESSGEPSPILDRIEQLLAELPELYKDMDHAALADAFECALGAAAVSGAVAAARKIKNRKSATTGLAADDMMVAFLPFEAAAAALDKKTPIRAALNSAQWAGVPAELRDRAMFSARVESARFLTLSRDRLAGELRLQREQLANGKQAGFSRDNFLSAVRTVAEEEGIDTSDGTFDGSIRDIRSSKRLGLIYDVQTEMAEEYGRYKMDLDPDVLDAYPAKRLVRVEDRTLKRDWTARWAEASDKVQGEGVAAGDDMVALKTSPIWTHLGPFQNPFPPYDFGSGMGDEDVDREDAEKLLLVQPGQPVQVPDSVTAFNRNLETGTADIDDETKRFMLEAFGSQVHVAGDTIKWTQNEPASPPPAARPTSPAYTGLSDNLAIALRDNEAAIRAEPNEFCVVFDENGVRTLKKTDGIKDQVSVTVGAIRNRLFVHNHPSSGSFSRADRVMACRANLIEMRVIGKNGTIYRLRRGPNGWPSEAEMKLTVRRVYRRVTKRALTEHEDYWHIENEEVAKLFRDNLSYERIKPNA